MPFLTLEKKNAYSQPALLFLKYCVTVIGGSLVNNPPKKKIAPCCQRLSSPAMPEKISDSESSFRIFPGTPGQNKIHTSGTFLTCELVSLMQSTFCMHKNSHACTLLFPSASKYTIHAHQHRQCTA